MKRPRGNPNWATNRNRDTRSATRTQQEAADAFAADLLPVLLGLLQEGLNVPQQAEWLNRHGHPTRLGREWTPRSLWQLYERIKARRILPSTKAGFVVTEEDISGGG